MAGTISGSVISTRITCSPNTIVAADVDSASGLRKSASVPHIAAAAAISATPGIVARPRATPASGAIDLRLERQHVVERLAPTDQARIAARDEHRGGPRHGV